MARFCWVIYFTETKVRCLRTPVKFGIFFFMKPTTPEVIAYKVSSLARRTLSPGWIAVPRWRTKISPERTLVPSLRLTPRRWARESRPFVVEPWAFLCAIYFRNRPSSALLVEVFRRYCIELWDFRQPSNQFTTQLPSCVLYCKVWKG